MGFLFKIGSVIALLVAVFLAVQIKSLFDIPPLPPLEDTWWGPSDRSRVDNEIKPFKISFADKELADLKRRLENTNTLTPPLEGIQHEYGINTNLLKEIIEFWKTKYDWREREKFLNKYPQYKVNIQGLNIHYLYAKPQVKEGVRVLPLLLLHGWPGSIREFYEIIPILTTPQKGRDYVFEVLAPSLPGYGFSDGAVRPGLGAFEAAILFKNFMKRLGYQKYYLQGGDWGAIIVQHMAVAFPEHVLGVHANMCFVNTPLSNLLQFFGSYYNPLVEDEGAKGKVYPLSKKFMTILEEMGYMHIQATKPDTVGVALNDSPAGLAAYIIEKFITWTNPSWKQRADGGLLEKFTYTKLLDNIMIYWISGSITTSVRLYSETFNKKQFQLGVERIPVTVPSACARFAHELEYPGERILRLKYTNLVHLSDLDGGHFAAMEVPETLASDIFEATDKFLALH